MYNISTTWPKFSQLPQYNWEKLPEVKLSYGDPLLNQTKALTNPVKSNTNNVQSEPSANNQQIGTKKGMSQNWQNALSSVGSLFGGISGSDLPESDKAVREGIRSTIGQFGPWGAAIAAASGVVDAVGDWTSTNLSNIDMDAAKRAGVGFGAGFNKAMNMIPGNSMLWGMFRGNTKKANFSSESQSLASGFGGSMQKLQDAQALSDKRMLFGRGKANSFINKANELNRKLTNMALENKRSMGDYSGQMQMINNQATYSGHTPGLTFAKHGGTIPELEYARNSILSLQSKKQEIQEPQKFQLGGKMNMIVTGALHARKHNLEELNPNLEGEITKKGIPVVVMNEGGEVQGQQAEVESGEIIMNFDTTKTIEDYYDEYNSTDSKTEKNKITLECGKYLVDELLKNTDDPDKLIKKTI